MAPEWYKDSITDFTARENTVVKLEECIHEYWIKNGKAPEVLVVDIFTYKELYKEHKNNNGTVLNAVEFNGPLGFNGVLVQPIEALTEVMLCQSRRPSDMLYAAELQAEAEKRKIYELHKYELINNITILPEGKNNQRSINKEDQDESKNND